MIGSKPHSMLAARPHGRDPEGRALRAPGFFSVSGEPAARDVDRAPETPVLAPGAYSGRLLRAGPSPSSRIAFSFRINGRTSGLMSSVSKSASQRSGVMNG